jgi:hypothetical protein
MQHLEAELNHKDSIIAEKDALIRQLQNENADFAQNNENNIKLVDNLIRKSAKTKK